MRPGQARYPLVVRAGLVVLGVASGLLAGCGRGAAEGGAPAVTAAMAAAEEMPVALPEPVESYTRRPGEFAALVGADDGRRWRGAGARQRECEGAGCRPGTDSTPVIIEAMLGAHRVDLGALPRNGLVIARMRNLGRHQEKLYRLLPASAVRGYYLVIEPLPAGQYDPSRPRARLKVVQLMPGNAPLRIETWMGGFNACDHRHPSPPDSTAADFVDCADAPGQIRNPGGSGGETAVAAFASARGWISCIHGCCEVGVRQ